MNLYICSIHFTLFRAKVKHHVIDQSRLSDARSQRDEDLPFHLIERVQEDIITDGYILKIHRGEGLEDVLDGARDHVGARLPLLDAARRLLQSAREHQRVLEEAAGLIEEGE